MTLGLEEPVRRAHALSAPPGRGRYAIRVKREPQLTVSRHLHDRVEPGALLSAQLLERLQH